MGPDKAESVETVKGCGAAAAAAAPAAGTAATRASHGQAVSEEQIKSLEVQCQEHKLGCILIAISFLFITCQSFKLLPDVYEIVFCRFTGSEGGAHAQQCVTTGLINKIVDLSHLLVCFNSAANFLIYLFGGEKFRRVWLETYVPDCLLSAGGCERALARRRRRRQHSWNRRSVHYSTAASGGRRLQRINTMHTTLVSCSNASASASASASAAAAGQPERGEAFRLKRIKSTKHF